jgi:hypothetical protein
MKNLSAYEVGTECSETSAYKIDTPGIYPEESIQQLRICNILEKDNAPWSFVFCRV